MDKSVGIYNLFQKPVVISITYVGNNLLGVVNGVIPNSPAILGILQYKRIILLINNENIKNFNIILLCRIYFK